MTLTSPRRHHRPPRRRAARAPAPPPSTAGERSATTSCSARSAAAAWAWSTRPGRSSLNRVVALKMILAGHARRRRRAARASAPRPRRRPASTTPASCRSTRSASTRASTTSRMEYVEGGSLADRAAPRAPLTRGAAAAAAWPTVAARRRTTPTSGASCTATSSRPTSCSTADDQPQSPTSAWPSGSSGDSGLTRDRGDRWARRSYMAAGAGRGQAAAIGAGDRRLRPGGGPLRAAHRPAAVPGGETPLDTLLQVLEQRRRCRRASSTPRSTATWRRSA